MKSKIYKIYHFYYPSNPLMFAKSVIVYCSGRVRVYNHNIGECLPTTAFKFASCAERVEMPEVCCVVYKSKDGVSNE